jgi:hypothetical protein
MEEALPPTSKTPEPTRNAVQHSTNTEVTFLPVISSTAKSEESLGVESTQSAEDGFADTVLVVDESEGDEMNKPYESDRSTPQEMPEPSQPVLEPLTVEIPDNCVVENQEIDLLNVSFESSLTQIGESLHSSASGESNLTLLALSSQSVSQTEPENLISCEADLDANHFADVPRRKINSEGNGDESSTSSVDSFVRCENDPNNKSKRSSSVSDRTGDHMSTDEGETCTSSDIEIISRYVKTNLKRYRLYNLEVKRKIIGWFIFCETMFPSGNNNEEVVKMVLVPKLAASTTANGCGINYSIRLYVRYLANHV